ncbi:MAG: hypothetical protein H6595_00905 [Flavobacteriales bacterium]|nr:hypothetical protein [Flavobacteriales bacterium]MCB9166017.1 hypothetical protein [Flavobacteriales bacterium]
MSRTILFQNVPSARYFVAVLFLASTPLLGQNEEDALRTSSLEPGGTARSMALGGAFGALGADPGALSVNPGGMALYQTTELSLTPSIEVIDARTTHYGKQAVNTAEQLYFNNLALSLHFTGKEGSAFKGSTFGVIYDRTSGLNLSRTAKAEALDISLVQQFVRQANGTPSDLLYDNYPFTAGLAWDTYLIDPVDTVSNTYQGANPEGTLVDHDHTITTTGANGNTSIFYATNYADKVYIGASIGILNSRLEQRTRHTETALDVNDALQTFTWEESLSIRGSGVDFKVGAVGRFTDRFRAGIAFHSPAFYSMNDAYTASITSGFVDGTSWSQDSPDGSYAYRIRTPWRTVVSAAYLAGQHGTVSVDYEYADFRSMRFRQSRSQIDDYDFSVENTRIKDVFQATHNVRIGTEWRFGPWYGRGGWAYRPDPYVNEEPRHGLPLTRYALGVGYRRTHVSLDLTLTYDQRGMRYYTYSSDLIDPVDATISGYRTFFTFTYRP